MITFSPIELDDMDGDDGLLRLLRLLNCSPGFVGGRDKSCLSLEKGADCFFAGFDNALD
jgi:hypothetical protein